MIARCLVTANPKSTQLQRSLALKLEDWIRRNPAKKLVCGTDKTCLTMTTGAIAKYTRKRISIQTNSGSINGAFDYLDPSVSRHRVYDDSRRHGLPRRLQAPVKSIQEQLRPWPRNWVLTARRPRSVTGTMGCFGRFRASSALRHDPLRSNSMYGY